MEPGSYTSFSRTAFKRDKLVRFYFLNTFVGPTCGAGTDLYEYPYLPKSSFSLSMLCKVLDDYMSRRSIFDKLTGVIDRRISLSYFSHCHFTPFVESCLPSITINH